MQKEQITPNLRTPTVRNVRVELKEYFVEGGYTAEFSVKPEGKLACGACGHTFEAGSAEIADVRRLEGQSDPADMSAVVAIECPDCATRGTVVLTYGAAASDDDADVLAALGAHDWKHEGDGGG